MKKNLIRTFFFLLVFAALFAFFNHLMMPKDVSAEAGIHEAHSKGFLSEPENSLDVLILGDSEVYSCAIPLQIWEDHGITAYGCGTSDQILFRTEDYLRRAFETQNPRIVLLEANILYRDHNTLDVIPHRLEEMFPLIRYHSRWKDLSFRDLTRGVSFQTIQRDKGYHFSGDIQAADVSSYMVYSEDHEPIPSKNVRHVENIAAFCRERGARLVLFSSPSPVNWSWIRHNSVEALAQRLEIPYLDLNLQTEEVGIDWNLDTFDGGDHMNYTGARKVTAFLGAYLAEQGIFEDKREDPRYDAWNHALEDFHGEIKNYLEP